jgi:hypothetical protein
MEYVQDKRTIEALQLVKKFFSIEDEVARKQVVALAAGLAEQERKQSILHRPATK